MIVIYHPKALAQAVTWRAKLEQMTVPHLVLESDRESPCLREGKKEVKGIAAIDKFLTEYKAFMAGWNQDRCDMWFFDEQG